MNHINDVLELLKSGVKPDTKRYRRMAEGSALTDRHKRLLKVTRWLAGILLYGGIVAVLIWILS